MLVFEDILGAMRSRVGGCAAGTGWGGQHDVGVEMAHRAAPAKLLCPASTLQLGRKEIWGRQGCRAASIPALAQGSPGRCQGACLGSCSGGEPKGTGLLVCSQPHPSFALLNKSWSDMGAVSSCLLSSNCRQETSPWAPLRLEEGSDPEHVSITNPSASKGLPLV